MAQFLDRPGLITVLNAIKKVATNQSNGFMSKDDKSNLDALIEKNYPFDITRLNVPKSLLAVGSAVDETFSMSWDYSNADRNPVNSQVITGLGSAITVNAGTKNVNISTRITTDAAKTFTATLTAKTSTGKTKSKSVSVVIQNYSYYGTVDGGVTVPTADQIKGLTQDLRNSKGRGNTRINQQNNKGVFAYPKSLGDLSSIKNSSGFEGIGGWTKNVVQVDGVDYNVYITNISATANDTYTFA